MNWLDIIFILALIVGAGLGAISGLFRQLVRILSLIIAAYLALIAHQPIAAWLGARASNPFLIQMLVFIFIFICVYLILFFIIWFIERGIKDTTLSPVNRILGGLFGLVKAAIICGTILLSLVFYPVPSLHLPMERSFFAPYLLGFTRRTVFIMPKKYKRQVRYFVQRISQERAEAVKTATNQPAKKCLRSLA